jgi:hypothetical protein
MVLNLYRRHRRDWKAGHPVVAELDKLGSWNGEGIAPEALPETPPRSASLSSAQ